MENTIKRNIDEHNGEKYRFLQLFVSSDEIYLFTNKRKNDDFFVWDREKLYEEFQILWDSLDGTTAEEKFGDLFISVVPNISSDKANLLNIILDVSIAYLLPNIFHYFMVENKFRDNAFSDGGFFSNPVKTKTNNGVCFRRRIIKGSEKRMDTFISKMDELSKKYDFGTLKEELQEAF